MSADRFIGVDVGTGSVRAGVFDATGKLLGTGRHDIRIWRDTDHRVEQSSDDIWAAVTTSVRGAVQAAGVAAEEIAGIGFDATCSLVLIGEGGQPVAAGPHGDPSRNIIVWMDHRAREQAARINAMGHEVLDYVGGHISPEMETPKLLWLAENLPESFADTRHFLDLTDYLTFRASGSLARSVCTLACKWTYLGHADGWQADYFKKIGLSVLAEDGFARLGAEVVPPGATLGNGLTERAASELGLKPGTFVASGLIDAHAGALGSIGAPGPGALGTRLAYVFGTSACTLNVTSDPVFVSGVWGPYHSALLPGMWLNEGGQSAAGAAMDALLAMHPFARELGEKGQSLAFAAEAAATELGGLDNFAALTKGLHIVPEFLGNRAPFADPDARAVISGLGMDADRESFAGLYLAGLASIAYGLGQIIDALGEKGITCELIVISGGAGTSALVRQILADATGCAVGKPATQEPVLLGAAMLAAVAAGKEPDLPTAAGRMTRFASITEPDPARRELHERRKVIFRELQEVQRRSRDV